MPQISIVIPLYNKEDYIERAIVSALDQKIQDFELIIVDDGSKDKSVEIVQGFNDKRIRLIQQQNAGVSAARNTGIEAAKAEIVAFLDADDEWFPNFLETIIRLREKYPDAGVYGTAYNTQYPGSIVPKVYEADKGERLIASYFGALVDFDDLIFFSSSFAAPKEVLKKVGGYPVGVKWAEDSFLWGKIALQYDIAYSPEVCSIYYQFSLNNSMSNSEYLENPLIEYIDTFDKTKILKKNNEEDIKMYSDLCRMSAVRRNIYSGHTKKAREELSHVTSTPYAKKRQQLLLMSYIPRFLMSIILGNAKYLSYLKWKLKGKKS